MIGIIKTNDLKNKYLCDYFIDYIYSNNESDFYNVNILFIGFLGVDNDLYIKNTNINLENIISYSKLKYLITYKGSELLKHTLIKNNITLIELINNQEFITKNSLLTAEGLINVIRNDIFYSLSDCKILLLGFGNVGQSIAKVLSVYNTIDIYTNCKYEIKTLLISNNKYVEDIVGDYDIIINTIPCNLFSLDKISSDTLVYDVSSYPYGFDHFNRFIKVVPSIPGNLLPKSAAKFIFEAINSYIFK